MNTTDPPSGWRRWWLGVRPPTLGLSLVPVLLGTALGVRLGGSFDPASFLVAAFCVLCIQAGTNLFNDAGDGARGADGADRLGPVRLVGSGLAAVAGVRRAARLCFALALAGPGRRVLGVEVSAPAVRGARESAALMGLPSEEVRFEVGDARVLDPGGSAVPDLLVVNPPRRGIGTGLARRIENSSAARVLYSSCNPVSLAADLEAMPSLRARRARLFDMFPHTDHAEVLVELVRRPPSRTAPSPTQTSSARAASTSTRRASTSAAA